MVWHGMAWHGMARGAGTLGPYGSLGPRLVPYHGIPYRAMPYQYYHILILLHYYLIIYDHLVILLYALQCVILTSFINIC